MVIADASGSRQIDAAAVTCSMAPDGKTITHLEANDHVVVTTPKTATAPARTISAASLVATGNDQAGLTDAVFGGGADFTEHVPAAGGRPASDRKGRSQTLTLKVKGQLDAIDEAHFVRGVVFTSGDVRGYGDFGNYLAGRNQLTLEPGPQAPRSAPHVTDGDMTVDASDRVIVGLD